MRVMVTSEDTELKGYVFDEVKVAEFKNVNDTSKALHIIEYNGNDFWLPIGIDFVIETDGAGR